MWLGVCSRDAGGGGDGWNATEEASGMREWNDGGKENSEIPNKRLSGLEIWEQEMALKRLFVFKGRIGLQGLLEGT